MIVIGTHSSNDATGHSPMQVRRELKDQRAADQRASFRRIGDSPSSYPSAPRLAHVKLTADLKIAMSTIPEVLNGKRRL